MAYDITSPSNERIRRLIRLRERKHRDTEQVFVVEGERLVRRAIETGLWPVEAYGDGSASVPTVEMTMVDPAALDRASYRQTSEGIIAVFDQFEPSLDRLEQAARSLVLVAESLEKPGNLGAMLRTADAVGADAFIVTGDSVDPFNPNVIRASTGALFTVPLAVCDMAGLVSWLGDTPIVAATPDAADPYWRHDFTEASAIMVGAEDSGLSDEATRAATTTVAIPMAGSSDSLNASVSLAVLAFEAIRQRSAAGT